MQLSAPIIKLGFIIEKHMGKTQFFHYRKVRYCGVCIYAAQVVSPLRLLVFISPRKEKEKKMMREERK